jgi:hypothetical protein
LISLVFELLKRCRECHVVPCMNKKTKVTCIGMHWSICQTVLWIECWRVEASLSISCLHKGSRANCEIVPRVPPFLDLCLGPSHRAHIMWCDADQISNHYAWKFWPVLYCSSAPRFPFCNSSAWSI